jgi:hypothetical protein
MTEATLVRSFDCGCGFRSDDERLAQNHAIVMQHNVTIHGRILVENPRRERRSRGGDRVEPMSARPSK